VSLPWLAGTWLAAAVLGAATGHWPQLRRAAALTGMAAILICCLLTSRSGTVPDPLAETSPLLSREAAGLLVAAAAALWMALMLVDRLDGRELLGIGGVGGAAALLLGARSPLLFGVAALIAVLALTLRWVSVFPGRATLAAGRVAGAGAAALVAASLFLPAPAPTGAGAPQVGMAAGLLAAGLVALAALIPLGGWAAGAMASLAAPEVGSWMLLLAPAVLVSSAPLAGALPLAGRLAVQHSLLTCGLISAVWAGVQASRVEVNLRAARRAGGSADAVRSAVRGGLAYRRLALGDLALVAVGVGTGQPVGLDGGLILILTHLVAAPLLLQSSRAGLTLPRRVLWLALTGVPPAPSFWGRFLVLQACAGFSGPVTIACLVALGLMTMAGALAVTRGDAAAGTPAPPHQVVAAWALGAAAAAVAVVPMVAVHLVFGATA